MVNKRVANKVVKEFVNRENTGVKATFIAKHNGISRSTLYRLVRKFRGVTV